MVESDRCSSTIRAMLGRSIFCRVFDRIYMAIKPNVQWSNEYQDMLSFFGFLFTFRKILQNLIHLSFVTVFSPLFICRGSITSPKCYKNIFQRRAFFFISLILCFSIKLNGKHKSNILLKKLSLNSFNDIWSVSMGCESQNINQGRSYNNINISISDCFFSRSSSYTGNGGVIYINIASISMSISISMFHNCVCSENGGAIFFEGSESFLRMICAQSCSCGIYKEGQFAYILTLDSNQMEYITISNSSYQVAGYHSMYLYKGSQRVENTNSSMNNAREGSGITLSLTPYTCIFCTFSNNKVNDHRLVSITGYSGNFSYSNIVHNKSPTNGVVYVGAGEHTMLYCIFHSNQNTLFHVAGGSLEILHSFIDHSSTSFSISTSVITGINNTLTNVITYEIPFFKSHYCNAEIPLPMKTIEETPMGTIDETPMNTLEETPMGTFEETPMDTLENTPMGTLEETPMGTIDETPMDTLEETPMDTLENTPMDTLEETPMDTLEETPMGTLEETPIYTLEETPMGTIDETPMDTLEETPMGTLEETPMDTLENTPMDTLEETPMDTFEETPMDTLEETPMATFKETPMDTLENTPINTLEETPLNAVEKTPMDTLEETPMDTLENTPMDTLEETPMDTPGETPINTLEETLMGTFEETANVTAINSFNQTSTPTTSSSTTVIIVIGSSASAISIPLIIRCIIKSSPIEPVFEGSDDS